MARVAFTSDMFLTLRKASDALKGTAEFGKYLMEESISALSKMSWTYVGWDVPFISPNECISAYIERGFIYQIGHTYMRRYRLRDEVKELLNLN